MQNGFELLYQVIQSRKIEKVEGSYTCYLFEQGLNKILKKCGEECSEMIIAAKDGSPAELVEELCDLIYHMEVLMVDQNISLEQVEAKLKDRSTKIGNLKQFHQGNRDS